MTFPRSAKPLQFPDRAKKSLILRGFPCWGMHTVCFANSAVTTRHSLIPFGE
jgi:hypothetical protein